MHSLYSVKYPDNKVSYKIYREIFNSKFNIRFCYPATSSYCNELKIKIENIENEINQNCQISKKISELNLE